MAVIASFAGVFLFGDAVKMARVPNPRSRQINEYFGLNGVEMLDGGSARRLHESHGVALRHRSARLGGGRSDLRRLSKRRRRHPGRHLGKLLVASRPRSF